VSVPAHAVFVARMCDDLQCMGGNDFAVQDNAAGDTIPMTGAISFAQSAFGYTILVNTSQSKPVIGSATAPQLDLSFVVTSGGLANNVFLYASDTDFTSSSPFFTLAIGGTNSGSPSSGAVTSRAWGGTSNTEFQISSANLLGAALGPLTGTMYSAANQGPFAATVSPFSLTIGTQISRTMAGTSTGDLNLQISAVPVPGAWALMLLGLAVIGFVGRRHLRT
jgi:hypothetical protein